MSTLNRPHFPCPACSQLIPLCIRHRLFAALIAIFTRALRDHQTPAALLLVAAAAAADAEEALGAEQPGSPTEVAAPDALLQRRESLRLAYKLLVFLRCCLLGQAYPPGERVGWERACWQAWMNGLPFPAQIWMQVRGLTRLLLHLGVHLPTLPSAGTGAAAPEQLQLARAQAFAFLLYSTGLSGEL